jgi:predicted RNase H-like nuclease (RuvC/YqgF family)
MARRPAIEAEELFDAANRLQSEGKEVTAVALLDAMGGGSLRTIYRHLEAWQRNRPTVINTAVVEIPAAFQTAFAAAWRVAAQQIDQSVLAVKEKATEETEAALRQFHGAIEAIGKLEEESEAAERQIEELKAKLTEAEAVAHTAQTEAATQRATADQLQKLVEKQDKDIERLRAEVETAETASKMDRAEREASMKEAAELKGQVEALKDQNAQLVSALGGKKS